MNSVIVPCLFNEKYAARLAALVQPKPLVRSKSAIKAVVKRKWPKLFLSNLICIDRHTYYVPVKIERLELEHIEEEHYRGTINFANGQQTTVDVHYHADFGNINSKGRRWSILADLNKEL